MTRQILRPIIIGILIGAAIFFAPFFLLRALLIILIISALLRFFFWGRYYRRYRSYDPDKIRNMSDEEYNAFKQNFRSRCGGYYNRDNEATIAKA